MSTDLDQVRQRMVAADPAPPGAEPPEEVMAADVLLDLIDERSGIMPTSTDTLEHKTGIETPRQTWKPAWAFAGAFVALVAAIGIAVAVTGNDGREVVDQPAPATTLAPTTTVAPQTTVAPPVTTTTVPRIIPDDITWELITQAAIDGFGMHKALSDGATVVAIGEPVSEEAPPVWKSENGLDWEPFVGGEALLGGLPMAGPAGFTSVSFENDNEGYGFVDTTAVARGDAGWIAVGRWEFDGRVWFSPDGKSWMQLDPAPFEGAWLHDVVAGGPGYVISGGFHGLKDDNSRPAIWISRNGFEWQRIEDGVGWFGSIHVDPRDGSLLAFGEAAVWRSANGIDWTVVHERDTVTWLSQPPAGADAVWVGDTIVAAGGDAAFSLWYSYDNGASWLRHNPEDALFGDDATVAALVEHDGRVIAVGSCSDCMDTLLDEETQRIGPEWGVIWVGTPN